MYVCLVNKMFGWPFIECILGGASTTSPLTGLYKYNCKDIGDLNGDYNSYVFKVVNKSLYGFRIGALGRNQIVYVQDITASGQSCQLVTFDNGIDINFGKYESWAVKGKNIDGMDNQELCLVVSNTVDSNLRITCTKT